MFCLNVIFYGKYFKNISYYKLSIFSTDQNNLKFSALKHSPSKKGKKESAIRRISNIKATNVSVPNSLSVDNTTKNSANADEVSAVTEKASNMSMPTAANKPESTVTSSQNGKLDYFQLYAIFPQK